MSGLSLAKLDMTGFFTGTGTLTIASGMGVPSLTVTGAATVNGTLNINGQTLSVGGSLTIAAGAGTGMLKTSAGGTLTAGATTVTSSGGTGTLDITNCTGVTVTSLSASGAGTKAFTAGASSGAGASLHATGTPVDFSGFSSISWTTGGIAATLLLDGAAIGTRSFNPGTTAIPKLTLAPGTPFTDTVLLGADLSVVTSLAVTSGTFDMNFKNITVTAGTAEVGSSSATTTAKLKSGVGTLSVSGIMYLNAPAGSGSSTLDVTGCSKTTIGGFDTFGTGTTMALLAGGAGSPLEITAGPINFGSLTSITWSAGASLFLNGPSTGATRVFTIPGAGTTIPNLTLAPASPFTDTVQQAGTGTLTVSGSLNVNSGTYDINAKTLAVSGTGTATIGSTATTTAILKTAVAGGSFTVAGGLTSLTSTGVSGAATLDVSGLTTAKISSFSGSVASGSMSTLTVGNLANPSTNLEVTGTPVSFTSVTTTWGASATLTFDGSGAAVSFTPNGTAIPNVTVSPTAAETVTLASGTLSVSGTLSMPAAFGTLDAGGAGKTISIGGSGTLSVAGGTVKTSAGGTLTVTGALSMSSGTLDASTGAGGTINLAGTITVSGGTLSMGLGTLHLKQTAGAPATADFSAAGFTNTWTTTTPGGTLVFDGTVSVDFTPKSGTTFGNVTVAHTLLADVVTFKASVTMGGVGALSVTGGTLDLSGNTLSVATTASISPAGVAAINGAKVMLGAGSLSVGAVTASALTLVNNTLAIGTLDASSAASSVTITAGFAATNLGVFNAGGGVTISSTGGTGAVDFSGLSATSTWASTMLLTLAGSTAQTLTPKAASGTSPPGLQKLSVTNTAASPSVTLAGASAAYTIAGTTDVGAGSVFDVSAKSVVFTSTITLTGSGTIQSTGTSGKTYTMPASVSMSGAGKIEVLGTTNVVTFTTSPSTVTLGASGTFHVSGGVTAAVRNSLTGALPGAGGVTIDHTGGGTTSVTNTKITNSTASPFPPLTTATNCVDLGGNAGWSFIGKVTTWTHLGGDDNWSTVLNWDSGPPTAGPSTDSVLFAAGGPSIIDIPGLTGLTSIDMSGFSGVSTLTIKTGVGPVVTSSDVTVFNTFDLNGETLTVGGALTVAAGVSTATIKTGIGGVLTVTGATALTATAPGTATFNIADTSGTTISSFTASGTGSKVLTAGSSSGGGSPLNAKGTPVDFSGLTSASWTTGGTGAPVLLVGPSVGTRTFKPGPTSLSSLTIAPSAGGDTVLLGGNLTVTSALAVTNGTLDMNFNNVTAGTAAVGSTATTTATLKTGVRTLTVTGAMSLLATGGGSSAALTLTGCSKTSLGSFTASASGGGTTTLTPGAAGSPLHVTGTPIDFSGLTTALAWPAGAQLILDGASSGISRFFTPTAASIPNFTIAAGAPFSDTVKQSGAVATLAVGAFRVTGGTYDTVGKGVSVSGIATIGSTTAAPSATFTSSAAGASLSVTGLTTLETTGATSASLDLGNFPGTTTLTGGFTNTGSNTRSLTVAASAILEVEGTTINFGGVGTTWGASSELLLDGASVGTRTLTPNGTAIPNVVVTSGADTVQLAASSGTLFVSSSFAVTSGTFDINGAGNTLSITGTGTLSISAGAATTSIVKTSASGTLTVAGGATSITTSSGTGVATLNVTGGAVSSSISSLSGSGTGAQNLTVTDSTLHATGTPVTLTSLTQSWGTTGTLILDGAAIGARSFTPAGLIPNLTVNTVTDTVTLGGPLTVGGSVGTALTISSGTLDAGGFSVAVSSPGTLTVGTGGSATTAKLVNTTASGSFSVASGATLLTSFGIGTSELNVTNFSTPTVASLTGAGPSSTLTVAPGQTFQTTGTPVSFAAIATSWGAASLLEFDGASAGITRTFTPNGTTVPNVTVACGTDTVSLASGTLTVSGTLSATGGTLTANGNAISVLAGGTLSITGATVQTGTGSISVSGSTSMSSGTFSGAGGTITLSGAISFTGGTLAMGTGTLHLSQTAGAPAVADFSSLGSNTWGTSPAGTLIFDGVGAVPVDFTPKGGTTFGNITVAHTSGADTIKLKASVTMGGAGVLSVTGGVLDINTFTLSVATSATIKPSVAFLGATVKVSGGTFSMGAVAASGFTLQNNGGTATLDATTGAVNLTTDTTGYPTANDGTFHAGGTVTISSSAGATPVDFTGMATSSVWAASMTLTLAGSSTQTLTPNGTVGIQGLALTKTGAGAFVNLAGAGPHVIAGTTTITTGHLQLQQGVTFSGPVTIGASGTLQATSGLAATKTITFSDTVGISGSFTFTDNPLTLSFTPTKAVTVSAGGTFGITGGGVSNRIQLFSTATPTQWTLTVSGGTVSVSGARIKDGFVSVVTTAASSSNGGNDTNWVFGIKTTQWTNGGVPLEPGDGLWSTATNWSNDVPAPGDTITYLAGTTKPSTYDLGGLSVNSLDMTGYTGTLTMNPGSALTVVGDATIQGSLALAGNSFTVGHNFTILGVAGANSVVTGAGGTLSVNTVGPGTTTLVNGAGTATIDGSNGTVNIRGSFGAGNTGTLTVLNCAFHASGATANFIAVGGFGPSASWGTGTLFLDPAGAAQTFTPKAATSVANLTIAPVTTNTVTFAGSLTATGALSVPSGTCDLGGNVLAVGGTASVTATAGITTLLKTSAGGSLTVTGATTLTQTGVGATASIDGTGATTAGITLGGTFPPSNNGGIGMADGKLHMTGGSVDFSNLAVNAWTTGTLFLDGGVALAFNPGTATYGNVTVSEGGATATLGGSLTLAGALSVTSGTLDQGGNIVTVGTSLSVTAAGAG
ncbi:hypothetical protein HY251_12365, partial [bacterium]|nr:hypothetical protein [bacterium]